MDLSFDDKEKFKDRTMQDITVFSGIVIERLVTHESSLSSRKTEAEVKFVRMLTTVRETEESYLQRHTKERLLSWRFTRQ